MKPGVVVTIRVNPRNAQSILDVLDAAGIDRRSKSYTACASEALSSLLESARTSGLIPEPDPYQYANRMEEYLGPQSVSKRKVKALGTLDGLSRGDAYEGPPRSMSARWASPVAEASPAPAPSQPPASYAAPKELDPLEKAQLREASARFTELLKKRDIAEENSAVVWSDADEAEYTRLFKIVYPDG